jgi:integral membrane sensor domain MASE1
MREAEVLHALAPAVKFLLASAGAALLAAIGYVGCFLATGLLPWDTAPSSIARYWIGDVNAILMLAPLLLVSAGWRDALRVLAAGWWLALVQALIVVLSVWLLFGLDDKLRIFYPLFVPMIWIAVRWGAAGALLAPLDIQIVIVVAMRE